MSSKLFMWSYYATLLGKEETISESIMQQDIKVCAFCKKNNSLTKEHLFPKSLLKHKKNERYPDSSARYLAKANKFIGGEATIGDVCAVCNNGSLSNLDSYFNKIYEKNISNFIRSGQAIKFKYDFDKLARWLLKVSYNSARVHDSQNMHLLEKCVDFILHGRPRPKGLSIFLWLVIPYQIRETDKIPPSLKHLKEIKPDFLRVAPQVFFNETIQDNAVVQFVQINSYLFLCLLPNQDSYIAAEWYSYLRVFQKRYPGICRLRSDKESMIIRASKIDIVKLFEYIPSLNLNTIFDLI